MGFFCNHKNGMICTKCKKNMSKLKTVEDIANRGTISIKPKLLGGIKEVENKKKKAKKK